MFKIAEDTDKESDAIILMCDMKPLQVGQIAYNSHSVSGHYVFRTADNDRVEVIDLTDPGVDSCWIGDFHNTKVRLLGPGEKLTIELYNE